MDGHWLDGTVIEADHAFDEFLVDFDEEHEVSSWVGVSEVWRKLRPDIEAIPYLIASHAFLLLLLLLLLLLRRRLQRKQLQLNFRHRHHCSLIKRSMTTWWHKTPHGSRRLHRHRQTGSTIPYRAGAWLTAVIGTATPARP